MCFSASDDINIRENSTIAVFLHLVILTSDKIEWELFFCPTPTPFSTGGVVPALVASYDMHDGAVGLFHTQPTKNL